MACIMQSLACTDAEPAIHFGFSECGHTLDCFRWIKWTAVMLARLVPYLVCSVLTAVGCGLFSLNAYADDDHERAHRARQAGKIKPLSEVLRALQREHPGQVLEVELEHEDESWTYEVKLLAPDGRVRKLHVNAATQTPNTVKPKDD